MSKFTAKQLEAINEYRTALDAAFDSRETFEREAQDDSANIFKTLKALRTDYKSDIVVNVMRLANVDASFINRHERRNKRFNVYSAEKVFNTARASVKAEALNAYSRVILLTAFNLTRAEMTMTHQDAQVSLCDKLKCDAAKSAHIVRYARTIATSTADTQSSSSINALQMFDVLRETRDDANNVAYTLNLESDVTKALLASLNVTL